MRKAIQKLFNHFFPGHVLGEEEGRSRPDISY